MDEQLNEIKETLHNEFETHTLACWEPPFWVEGKGWAIKLSLYSKETYQGAHAFLILSTEQSPDFSGVKERLAAVVQDIKVDPQSSIDDGLATVFDLPELPTRLEDYAPTVDDVARREAALADSFKKFPRAAERFREIFGFQLPKHVAVWHAFNASLDVLEQKGADYFGRSPAGFMFLFDDPLRQTRDGIDPKVHFRYRADPPEFITIAGGDSDGLHFGLWYDDDGSDLPAFIVSNYARDSAETGQDGLTMIATLWEDYVERAHDVAAYGYEPHPASMVAYAAALQWFLTADNEAAEELKNDPNFGKERPTFYITGGLGPALEPHHGNGRTGHDRYERIRDDKDHALSLVEQAKKELASGKPAFALVLGRELHWHDQEGLRESARELLVGAYKALGRARLAVIVEAHYTHRDLQSVGVF